MNDRNETSTESQAGEQAQNEARTNRARRSSVTTESERISAVVALALAAVIRFGDRLEAHCELTAERIRAVPSCQRVGVTTALLTLFAAVHPAAAQSEFCDSAFGDLILALEGLGVGVGTAVLGFMLLIGVAMMVLTPIFPGQSAVGLVLVFMVLTAGVLMVFGLAFLGLIFDVAGVGGESCSTLVD
jgi:hypothetical protein